MKRHGHSKFLGMYISILKPICSSENNPGLWRLWLGFMPLNGYDVSVSPHINILRASFTKSQSLMNALSISNACQCLHSTFLCDHCSALISRSDLLSSISIKQHKLNQLLCVPSLRLAFTFFFTAHLLCVFSDNEVFVICRLLSADSLHGCCTCSFVTFDYPQQLPYLEPRRNVTSHILISQFNVNITSFLIK